VEAAGDHEVEREEQIALEREDDPLPEPPHRQDPPPLRRRDGRFGRAQEERAPEPDTLERRALDASGDRLDVHLDVRELRHVVNNNAMPEHGKRTLPRRRLLQALALAPAAAAAGCAGGSAGRATAAVAPGAAPVPAVSAPGAEPAAAPAVAAIRAFAVPADGDPAFVFRAAAARPGSTR
jgi:hypothetical protein